MCVDYWYFSMDCTKDNYTALFIKHVIDDCVGNYLFLLMDAFYGYNQIDICLKD